MENSILGGEFQVFQRNFMGKYYQVLSMWKGMNSPMFLRTGAFGRKMLKKTAVGADSWSYTAAHVTANNSTAL